MTKPNDWIEKQKVKDFLDWFEKEIFFGNTAITMCYDYKQKKKELLK